MVPMLWAIRDATPRRAFFIGWVTGTVGHAGGFYWVVHMFRVFAFLPLPLAAIGCLGLAAINAVSLALFAWCVRRLRVDNGWSVGWTAPLVWVGIEHFYPYIFPNYLGASQYLLPAVTQIADLTGIMGVSFFVVFCNSLVYEVTESLIGRRPLPRRLLAVFACYLLLLLGYGAWRIASVDAQTAAAPKIKVALIQSNLGAQAKHADRDGFLRTQHRMSLEAIKQQPIDLLVWPEGAYNDYLRRDQDQLPSRVLGPLTTPVLFGALTLETEGGLRKRYNSALLADASHRVLGRYDKRILVPFGEYIPGGDLFPIIYKWSPYSGRYYPGQSLEPVPFLGYLLSLNICYEDLFPGLIRDLLIGNSQAATVLPHAIFNLTNDSWYGDTTEPLEHLVLASFRAIENRRPLVRSTNTGISVFIDPVGRIQRRSGQWTREVVVDEVPMMTGRTVFMVVGNWFGWAAFALLLVGMGQALWNARRHRATPDARQPPHRAPGKSGKSKRKKR
ncbi:MAG: apolipoprotein N-acyltransferase [Deltaproteobacteria bacterium]|nr:apolipoprotein N-acyltransferase [Deltaproteobacteria bacterium]